MCRLEIWLAFLLLLLFRYDPTSRNKGREDMYVHDFLAGLRAYSIFALLARYFVVGRGEPLTRAVAAHFTTFQAQPLEQKSILGTEEEEE